MAERKAQEEEEEVVDIILVILLTLTIAISHMNGKHMVKTCSGGDGGWRRERSRDSNSRLAVLHPSTSLSQVVGVIIIMLRMTLVKEQE